MLKRFGLGWLGLLVALAGCSNEVLENEISTHLQMSDETQEIEVTLSEISHLVLSENKDTLFLVDVLTNEIVNEFWVEGDHLIVSTQTFPGGYYGAFIMDGMEIVRDDEGFLVSWGSSSTDNLSLSLWLFDADLHVGDRFEITDESLFFEWSRSTVLWIDGAPLIYYHDSMLGEGLYVYHATTNSRELVMEMENGFLINQLQPTSMPDLLAFYGSRLGDEIHTYYGVINLETQHMKYAQTDLPVSGMVVQGNYLLLTENPPPSVQGGVSRGEVVLFNLTTGEDRIIQLDPHESRGAMVIGDRYVLTGSHEWIRLYDIETNSVRLEHPPSVEMIRIKSEINASGEHVEGTYPHIHTFLAIEAGLYAVIFDGGDGTLHAELIVL